MHKVNTLSQAISQTQTAACTNTSSSCIEKHMTLQFCVPKYSKVGRMQISHNAQGKATFMWGQ